MSHCPGEVAGGERRPIDFCNGGRSRRRPIGREEKKAVHLCHSITWRQQLLRWMARCYYQSRPQAKLQQSGTPIWRERDCPCPP